MSYNSFKVIRNNGALGRRTPSDYKIMGLVGTGVAVAGKLALGTVYTLKSTVDANLIGLDAAYDTTNNILVYHHIARFFMREPSGELRFMLAAQTVSLTDLVDKNNQYAKKVLKDGQGKVKWCAIFRNPATGYTPVLTTGLDGDVLTAVPKAQELYEDEAQYFRFSGFLIEGRQFNGTTALAKDLRTLLSTNVSVTILQDPAVAGANAAWAKYAAVGDILGLKAKADISQDFGELIEDFNLTNAANSAFIDIGLSSGQLISDMQDTDMITLDQKGYIFGSPVPTIDGFYVNDTHTCDVLADNDYAYIENNSVIEAATSLAQAAIIRKTKSRLLINSTTGLLLPEIKTSLENDLRASLNPLVDSGDISGGVDAQIPDQYQDEDGNTITQNLLANSNIFYELTFVPVAIGRSITLRIGFNNPNNS
jgi:hypothetical protein